jgi:hypothetical protein
MYWILERKSELSVENKLLIYKTIRKPIWTYGTPLWGTASNSNVEMLQRYQNKVLRTMVNSPWYIPYELLHTDLQISTVTDEITKFSTKYRLLLDLVKTKFRDKLLTHPNQLTSILLEEEGPRRLKRYKPANRTNNQIFINTVSQIWE